MKNSQPFDQLVFTAIFSPDINIKNTAKAEIRKIAGSQSIYFASTDKLYRAIGQEKLSGFTIPAINVRTMTYDMAKLIFQIIKEKNIGIVIFEIARSEQGYTEQDPDEFTVAVMAGAIASDYHGPVFLQGDHYQFKKTVFRENPEIEIEKIKALIKKSIDAGFYNIDIDASTLVDLEKPDLIDQQKNNYEMTALLTEYIRANEPQGITVSIGGEIGHIGGKNSTVSDFEAFMSGYLKTLKNLQTQGISKVSVQTGTSHGGVLLSDGTMAPVSLDFDVLKNISRISRGKYHIGGAVQHGASTLENDLFDKFPANDTLEIHLATGFQNIIYENMPQKLRDEMYEWVSKNLIAEKKPEWNQEQFIYKLRKKAFGPFKEKLWQMPEMEKNVIMDKLKAQLILLFGKLKIEDTKDKVSPFV